MRTGGTLFHSTHVSKATAAEATNTAKATFSPPAANIQRSPWHSPVPYLFGGLAAMLGLIAFALLILACSYWKLSGQVNGEGEDSGRRNADGDAEKGENSSETKAFPVFEEKFLVIMAGDVKPTFLATPMSSRASSFNDQKLDSKGNHENDQKMNINRVNDNQLSATSEETQESQLSQERIH